MSGAVSIQRAVSQGHAAVDGRDADAAGSRLRRLHDRIEDWLAGYPDKRAVRVVHRAPMVLWRLGLGRIEGDVVLTTTGRKSGLPRRIVIGPSRIDGRPYLWDPYGDRAHWYRNLIADPIVSIQDSSGAWTARAMHPTAHDEAVALYGEIGRDIGRRFHEYLADLGVEDSPDGFARDIERIHVVRLDPVDEPGPPALAPDLTWVWPVGAIVGLTGLLARRSRQLALVAAATSAALLVLRSRALVDRRTELAISRPTHPSDLWHRAL